MSDVKRLNFTVSQFESVVPYASEHGQYVRFADYAKLEAEAQALREEVAGLEEENGLLRAELAECEALRARVVVDEDGAFDEWWEGSGFRKYRETAMAAWEARARLNGKAVSEGLLRRFYEANVTSADFAQLGALLGEGKEVGDVLVRE